MAASVNKCLILINLEISPIISKFLAVIKHFFNKSCKFENLPYKEPKFGTYEAVYSMVK